MPVGVFVLGVYRGGTSATVRALNLMGLPLSHDHMRKTQRYESHALHRFHNDLLADLGSSWEKPPASVDLESLVAEREDAARRAFNVAYLDAVRDQWLWKDPCLSLFLDFWTTVLDCDPVVVLMVRHPFETALSLRRRNALDLPDGLALWEHYVGAALTHCETRPSYVTTYDELCDDPLLWTDRLRAFLSAQGLRLTDGRAEVAEWVRPGLHHQARTSEETMTTSQAALWDRCRELQGPHPDGVPALLHGPCA